MPWDDDTPSGGFGSPSGSDGFGSPSGSGGFGGGEPSSGSDWSPADTGAPGSSRAGGDWASPATGGAGSDWGASPKRSGWDEEVSPAPSAVPSSTGRTNPPTYLLGIGAVTVLISAGLWFVGGWGINVIGWAIAAFGGLASAFLFMTADLRARTNAWYIANPTVVRPLQTALIIAAVGVAAAHAWSFADWASRQNLFA